MVDLDGQERISYRIVKIDAESGIAAPIKRVLEVDVYIAANEKGKNGAYKFLELSSLRWAINTGYNGNGKGFLDEDGLPVEFRFNFKTFDPKVTKQTQLADDLWSQKIATDELSPLCYPVPTVKGVSM